MLAEKLNWVVEGQKRLMKRLKSGRYEGVCKNGKRVRIDRVGDKWELYMGQEFIGSYPLKRTALKKANALLTSEECDEQRK